MAHQRAVMVQNGSSWGPWQLGGMGKKLGSRCQEEARPLGRHSTRCPCSPDTACSHLYVESKRIKRIKVEENAAFQGREEEWGAVGDKVSVVR